jgi:hypothetical protein
MSVLFVAIAISMPVQIMSLYGHGFSEAAAILNKLTVFNWLVMIALAVSAFMVANASPGFLYSVWCLIGLVAVNNFFVGYHAIDYSPWSAAFATVAFGAINLPLLRREDIRFLMANPDSRWWRVSLRKTVHLPVILTGKKFQRVRGETFDLSESGMFVPMMEGQAQLQLHQKISITLTLGTFAQIRCDGRVVRFAEAKGKYPSGMGIEFIELSRHQKLEIKKYLSRRDLEPVIVK